MAIPLIQPCGNVSRCAFLIREEGHVSVPSRRILQRPPPRWRSLLQNRSNFGAPTSFGVSGGNKSVGRRRPPPLLRTPLEHVYHLVGTSGRHPAEFVFDPAKGDPNGLDHSQHIYGDGVGTCTCCFRHDLDQGDFDSYRKNEVSAKEDASFTNLVITLG